MADPAFNRDPAFIHALVRLYPAFIRRRRLIEEIRYMYIHCVHTRMHKQSLLDFIALESHKITSVHTVPPHMQYGHLITQFAVVFPDLRGKIQLGDSQNPLHPP